jgi:hypothetical protein
MHETALELLDLKLQHEDHAFLCFSQAKLTKYLSNLKMFSTESVEKHFMFSKLCKSYGVEDN